MAATPLLLRHALLLRSSFRNYQPFSDGPVALRLRLWCSAAANLPSDEPDDKLSSGPSSFPKDKVPSSYDDDVDYRQWKEQILNDIHPIVLLAKDILHSLRYVDGERLTMEDEKDVVEKLLAYHPKSEDKIGCGIESIMVNRHPQFPQSRCLFVVRTDGSCVDFSYHKCLREYIRDKYPTHAERIIRKHFKRGSG